MRRDTSKFPSKVLDKVFFYITSELHVAVFSFFSRPTKGKFTVVADNHNTRNTLNNILYVT